MFEIIKDVDLIQDTEKYDVILLGTNVYQMFANGLQLKMKNKYPVIQAENDKRTNYGDTRLLGKRLTIKTGDNLPSISLCYIHKFPRKNLVNIDYDALEKCILTANSEFNGLRVATTILGSSEFDGNGDKEKCLEILQKNSHNLKLYVYDYRQKSKKEEIYDIVREMWELYKTDREKYEYYKKNKKKIRKERYLA